MKEKTTEELLQEFLDKGGEIQKIPAEPYEHSTKVGSTIKKVPQLKTLAEGELLYGERKKSKKKKKVPDYSGIKMDLIPDHIKKLINYSGEELKTNTDKEETHETDKDSRSSEASDKS